MKNPALHDRVNCTPIEYYYRNVSTGKPTLRHIINPNTDKSFCGFQSEFAQSVFEETDETIICTDQSYHNDTCVKCLKSNEKQI